MTSELPELSELHKSGLAYELFVSLKSITYTEICELKKIIDVIHEKKSIECAAEAAIEREKREAEEAIEREKSAAEEAIEREKRAVEEAIEREKREKQIMDCLNEYVSNTIRKKGVGSEKLRNIKSAHTQAICQKIFNKKLIYPIYTYYIADYKQWKLCEKWLSEFCCSERVSITYKPRKHYVNKLRESLDKYRPYASKELTIILNHIVAKLQDH